MDSQDRRTHKRYVVVQEEIFASISAGGLVGKVKDLSIGGVSFTCMASDEPEHSSAILQLFSRHHGLNLKHIPVRIISESCVISPNPYSSLKMKRISGAFYNLTERQKYKLELFIEKFAETEV